MKKTTLISLLAAAMLPLAASGQEQAQPLTSADATALFRRIDVNKDQRIAAKEAADLKEKRAMHKRLQEAKAAKEAARIQAKRKAEAQQKRAELIRQAKQKEEQRPSRRKP